MAAQSTPCWVWRPANTTAEFKHPADVPTTGDAAKVFFSERGPQLARLSPATMLQQKGSICTIAEKGAMLEVPKIQVLHWYEGLLVLEGIKESQELPGHVPIPWFNEELQQLLDKERKKFANGGLNGSLYAEKRLLKVAVTGLRYVDGEGKEWHHRRDNCKGEDTTPIADGEDGDGFFKIKEIVGYLPPWEAFNDEKCGFYQEFFQVKWEFPFSEVDYSSVENGCKELTGATWEPDECLPSHLDPLRLKAKKDWIKTRREKDAQKAREKKNEAAQGIKRKPGESPPGTNGCSPGGLKREKSEDLPPPVKMAKVTRDGKPLEQDVMFSRIGHDFRPESIDQTLGQIRSGWPKRAEDYPKGFAVASPPGFCAAQCDCMDDQRPQRSWETQKKWLEEPSRTQAAMAAMQAFSDRTDFVRRRGQVSKMFYFQTHEGAQHDPTCANSALEFGSVIEKTIQDVLVGGIPIASLEEADEVRIPARVFLPTNSDYMPLSHVGSLFGGGGPLPDWLRVCRDTGRISCVKRPAAIELPTKFSMTFHHAEGLNSTEGAYTVVLEVPSGSSAPWVKATTPIAQKFVDLQTCTLDRGVRNGLLEHFRQIYDFQAKAPRELGLGAWLSKMTRIAGLLRCAGGASLALGDPTKR